MQIAADELTPGISAREFAARRSTLAASLPVGGMAVLGAATTVYMTGVIPFPYRQHADFLYLTGLTQVHPPASCSRLPLGFGKPPPRKQTQDNRKIGYRSVCRVGEPILSQPVGWRHSVTL